jgi:hypothetical protein
MRRTIAQSGERSADTIFTLLNLTRSSYSTIQQMLKQLKGVRQVRMDQVTNSVLVGFDPDHLTRRDICELLQEIG